ncbi:MAG: DUF1223 domain-containing protein [Bacteroidetes bacterium]|nr:DUF1223 domain-containing protein [Bacteroidota bacterium]MBU1372821.1 DUF1223 domain-containing protein [Bacteroidota bacterium]MBU1485550.1 DUF1223 domain-containing protein [Bacteroidota bacterium]MBU1760560.1 DUF1223 domain-containing protein [Bacteroidota bacterium]MBU2046362.1 DUF1223 domain-containing protein [Bacteroidota bacterium]
MKRILVIGNLLMVVLLGCLSFSSDESTRSNLTENKGFAVIELYTSEGCSSCPSADNLLKQIREEYKNQEVYVLAYHVDYWNRLGWKDKFSDHQFTERQSAYANNFKNSSVYTPQAIVNGKDEMVGSAAGELKNSISKFLKSSNELQFSSKVEEVNSQSLKLSFDLPINAQNKDLVVNLIEKDISTNVKAGENGGRVLAHANVVRAFQRFIIESTKKEIKIEFPIDFKKENLEIIAFVQEKNQGAILGVARTKL